MTAGKSWESIPLPEARPDFSNLLAVLRRERPTRPTLFEFFLNDVLHRKLAGVAAPYGLSPFDEGTLRIKAFAAAGYDYATITSFLVKTLAFPTGDRAHGASISMNEGGVIVDRATFDAYRWQDPDVGDYSLLDSLSTRLPQGMKLIVSGPGGILENAMSLVGYETFCCMIYDNEPLAFDICEAIGSRLLSYYKRCLEYDSVGAIVGNDDWGFKSQTMLSPDDMRRFIFPWHRQIVEAAHAAGKPAILHSCGRLAPVMEDVIGTLQYDGKHSYEDAIQPVESVYDEFHSRIAILGGLDVDFVCRASPEEVYKRSAGMFDRSARDGAYALGTGNSVPEYVPHANYFAMIRAALDCRNK